MIPCPSCGTRNRRGSKYCYSCGERLDVAFDVSCPTCDRLNPGGSAFCAFCGAKIPVSPAFVAPVAPELSAVTERPELVARQHLEGEVGNVGPIVEPQHGLPSWLYEDSVQQPEAAAVAVRSNLPSSSVAKGSLEQSRYLSDIPGALPQTRGWLSSVPKPRGKPAASRVPESKPEARNGCLTLVLPVFVLAAALAVFAM